MLALPPHNSGLVLGFNLKMGYLLDEVFPCLCGLLVGSSGFPLLDVWMCVHGPLQWIGIPTRVNSFTLHPVLQQYIVRMHLNPDQNKTVTEERAV